MKYFNNIIAILLITVLFSCTPKQPDNSIDKKIEADSSEIHYYYADLNEDNKKNAVKGDFNGDGILDYAWLVAPKIDDDGMDCVGNCISYIKFSDPTIPMIKVNNCIGGIPDNLGDLNKDGTDEIGLLPWWFTSCWKGYYVWTLKNDKWRYAVEPFSTHCNQWDEGVTPIEIDLSKNGFVLIRYSELTDEDIVTKTKSVPLK